MTLKISSARPLAFGLVSGVTAVTLMISLLIPGAAVAETTRSSFPSAPTEAKVEGELASIRSSAGVEKTSPSPLSKPIPASSETMSFSQLDTPEELGKSGITVKNASHGRAHGKLDSSPIMVSILSQKDRKRLGGVDLAIEVRPSGVAANDIEVEVPSRVLQNAFGADFDSRVQWSIAPSKRANDVSERKSAVESARAGTTTLRIPTSAPMTLMASSSTVAGNGSGSFSATSLKPSGSWDVSAQTGAFAWSLPIKAPPAPAGDAPEVSLEYNSQLVDGATSSTNNQTSAVGEGWTLGGGGFIERRYVACSQEDGTGSPVSGSADLCWATDNATVSFGGRSGAIVRDSTTGAWRLENDDNSKVEKLIGTGQGCADNGTYNAECWRITTTDGTQYYFGLNKLPGWSAGKETTNSAWTVPVFGNDAADPCHAATFAASSCQQGWRWNLDYSVDVNGNAQALYYKAETNKYRANNSAITSYVRGGQLSRIDYGLKASTIYSANAATGRILFDYDTKGRCNPANLSACSSITLGGDATTPSTPSVYPDVPFDLNCVSGDCAGQSSPAFFTTARLATITTQSGTGGTYKSVDQFKLTHSFPDPGDSQSPALWLDSVQRTAMPGTGQIVENATTFQKTPLQNRVWVVDGLAPLDKFRISSVTQPTGARTSVNYSSQECTPAMAPSILASPWSNDKRCFPEWWSADLKIAQAPKQDLFHKYVVTSMIDDPYTGGGGAPAIRTNYVYTGTPGWRYVNDPLVPSNRRTWSDYAGYDSVEVRVGDPASPSTQETTQYKFYRGMNGDRANATGGTKTVNVSGTSVPDERWFAGEVRDARTQNGVGGAVVSETLTTPWVSAVTANDGSRQSRIRDVSRSDEIAPLSTGGTRTTSTINTFDARGFITQTSSEAGAGQRATCTTTQYAADNASAGIVGLPSAVINYAVPCSQVSSAPIPSSVLSYKRMSYDSGAIGTAPSKGLVTATSEAKSFAGNTLSSAEWSTTSAITYDSMGRPTSSTDVANRTTYTAYTPSDTAAVGAGPLATTTVTNPMGWGTATTVDDTRGLAVVVVDANGKTSSNEYDALGRLTKVWTTDRTKAANPSSPTTSYEYGVNLDKPSFVKKTALIAKGTISSYTLFDGLGRQIQTQAPATGGGALINDIEYDSAGRQIATNSNYWAPAVTPGTALFVPSTINQIGSRKETTYDAAGRPTADILRSFGTEIRRTTTAYRGGDRTDTTPPSGGIPTTTITDAWGKNVKTTQWQGTIDGAGVLSTSLTYQYNGRDDMTRMTDDAGNVWTWSFDQRGRANGSSDPDVGTITQTLDEIGNVLTQTDARGVTLAYTYDALDRKITERDGSATGTVLASWNFDSLAKGYLTSSTRVADGLSYTSAVKGYDSRYRPSSTIVTIPQGAPAFAGTTYATSLYYNQDGSPSATSLPAANGLAAETLYPSYDTLGRQNGLSGALAYASQISYTASGQLGQIARAGTTWSALTFGYAAGTEQLSSLEETSRRNNVFTREALREYSRNQAGIITRASTTSDTHAADVQCFRYAASQALTDAWTPASGDCSAGPTSALAGPAPYRTSYKTDPVTSNRTETTNWNGGTANTSKYTYPSAGSARPHAVQQIATSVGNGQPQQVTYASDASGAMTSRAAETLSYDSEGRLAATTDGSTTERSIYTADGELLLRWGGTDGSSLFVGDTTLRTKDGISTGVRTYTAAGIDIAERVSGTGGGIWWLSPDPVGTAGLEINVSTGSVTRRWMDPFGVARGAASTWSSLHGYLNAPQSATGLTHLGAREYDPVLGQFITTDPKLDSNDPRHSNAYIYSFNSPVSYSDPTGLIPALRIPEGGVHVGKGGKSKKNSVTPPSPGNTHGKLPKFKLPLLVLSCEKIHCIPTKKASFETLAHYSYSVLVKWQKSDNAASIRSVGRRSPVLLNDTLSLALSTRTLPSGVAYPVSAGFALINGYEGGAAAGAGFLLYKNFQTDGAWDAKVNILIKYGYEGSDFAPTASGTSIRTDTLGNVMYGAMMATFAVHKEVALGASQVPGTDTGRTDQFDNAAVSLGYQMVMDNPGYMSADAFSDYITSHTDGLSKK